MFSQTLEIRRIKKKEPVNVNETSSAYLTNKFSNPVSHRQFTSRT